MFQPISNLKIQMLDTQKSRGSFSPTKVVPRLSVPLSSGGLIARHGWINLARPGINSATQVLDLAKAGLSHER